HLHGPAAGRDDRARGHAFVILSVSEGPGRARGAQRSVQRATRTPRSLAHARDDGYERPRRRPPLRRRDAAEPAAETAARRRYRRPRRNSRYSSAVPRPQAALTSRPTVSSLTRSPVNVWWRSGAITNAAT